MKARECEEVGTAHIGETAMTQLLARGSNSVLDELEDLLFADDASDPFVSIWPILHPHYHEQALCLIVTLVVIQIAGWFRYRAVLITDRRSTHTLEGRISTSWTTLLLARAACGRACFPSVVHDV